MLFSLLRSLKVRQVGQVQLNLSVNGTNATPVASGPDKSYVLSVVDNGVGSYTINFKESAKMIPHISSIVSLTADTTFIVTAATVSSITIGAKSVGTTPAAKDADFNLQIQWMDQLSYYF